MIEGDMVRTKYPHFQPFIAAMSVGTIAEIKDGFVTVAFRSGRHVTIYGVYRESELEVIS